MTSRVAVCGFGGADFHHRFFDGERFDAQQAAVGADRQEE